MIQYWTSDSISLNSQMVFSITKDYFIIISHAQKATLHKRFASIAFQYQSLLHVRIYTSENKTHSHQVWKRLKKLNVE